MAASFFRKSQHVLLNYSFQNLYVRKVWRHNHSFRRNCFSFPRNCTKLLYSISGYNIIRFFCSEPLYLFKAKRIISTIILSKKEAVSLARNFFKFAHVSQRKYRKTKNQFLLRGKISHNSKRKYCGLEYRILSSRGVRTAYTPYDRSS